MSRNFTASKSHRDGMTADDHRAAAKASRQAAYDSFERCDTDGALSQWASGLTADEHMAHAELLDCGGVIETMALFDAETGKVASTHQGFGQFGEYWVLRDDAAAKFGKRFFSPSNARKGATKLRNDSRRGFTLGEIKVKGIVGIGGGSMLSCRAIIVPDIDAMRADDFEVVHTADEVGTGRYRDE
jgi:hypothetical protein